MRPYLPMLVLAALLAAIAPRPAQAQVLFDNFGPGNSYNSGIGWTLGLTSPPIVQGEAFTPSVSANLSSIEAAINLVSGPNDLTLKLMTDVAGQPGTAIETWFLSGAMGTFGDQYPTVTVTSLLNPLLYAGTQYWVVPFVSYPTWAAWNRNSTGDTGPHAGSNDGGVSWNVNDNVRGAFRVIGGPEVPEPGALALLFGAGSAGTLLLIRRRRR